MILTDVFWFERAEFVKTLSLFLVDAGGRGPARMSATECPSTSRASRQW